MRNKERRKNERKRPLYRNLVLSGIILVFFSAFGFFYLEQTSTKVEMISGLSTENIKKIELEKKIIEMVRGYPIEKMVPYIIEKDPKVVAFLISIAKKESNWGKRVPHYKNRDCFNYWGYRGPNRIGSGKHSCFSSRKEAVDIVGKRIEELIYQNGLNTPAKMIVWKCGSSCKGHSTFGVQKWISDVNYYYKQLQTKLF